MVHERTKKVTTHCVKFGDEIERAARRIKKVSRTNTKPLVTFVFKYKSLDLLKADGIVQSSVGNKRRAIAEPEVNIKDEVIEIDDDSDAIVLKTQRQTRSKRVNSSRANITSEPGVRHKQLKTEAYYKKSFAPGDIVDLT